tara:strand:- start:460 stop:1641 length:1182 start_codon:yes stop_codon:yes gene_type:complete
MSPWDRLELAPTSDTRAIKKAYARLLKQHRPDQDAAAFQQLHQAYKTALALAEQQTEEVEDVPPPTPPCELEPERLANWSIQLTPVTQPEPPAEPEPAADYQPLFQRCRELLAEHHGARQPQYWEFLARSPELLDDSLRHHLSHALFEELVRHQRDAEQLRSNLTPVEPAVLNHLNRLFGWDSRQDELLYGPDTTIRESLFDMHATSQPVEQGLRGSKKLIRQKPQKQEEVLDFYYFGSMLHRCIAVAIDLFAIGIVVDAILKWPPLATQLDPARLDDTRLLVTFGFYILIASSLEHSRWQATPGKWLLGLRVTDTNVQPLRWRHTLMRAGCMLAVLALILINDYLDPRAGLLFAVLFVANCFMNGNLVQDHISRTHVINLRLSRRRHRQATA